MKVSLTGYSHTASGDVDILLVSPNGKGLVLMSDVPSPAVSNLDLTFDDAATSTINSSPIISGTYKPTDNTDTFPNSDFFPSPAPLPPYHANNAPLNNFNNYNPNGDWRLFIVDDSQNNAGSISGGWSLGYYDNSESAAESAELFESEFQSVEFSDGRESDQSGDCRF